MITTEFQKTARRHVKNLGGWYNAHAHIDRAHTMQKKYYEHADMDPWQLVNAPLKIKQHATGVLHEGLAYRPDELKKRITSTIKEMIHFGYRRIDSFVDTTADCIGTSALEIALEIKHKYRQDIDFRVGAYPIFGFRKDKQEYWDVFVKGAEMADFIGTLPERDALDKHIGYNEHIRKVIELANSLGNKEVHMHVDQTNDPEETGTETLIEAIRWLRPDPEGHAKKTPPTIWAVHALSVASYDEERFQKLKKGLIETNIGIRFCPCATLSNKQDRTIYVPMHNAITRVCDYILDGIPMLMGTDNIDDVFCPTGEVDMYPDLKTAAEALRFQCNPKTWAKVTTGSYLNAIDRKSVEDSINT